MCQRVTDILIVRLSEGFNALINGLGMRRLENIDRLRIDFTL